MISFDGSPLLLMLLFLLVPFLFIAAFIWLVPAMLKRAGFQPMNAEDMAGDFQQVQGDRDDDTGTTRQSGSGWKFFGPSPLIGLGLGLAILLLSLLISSKFLPGLFLIFPFFFAGGWKGSWQSRRAGRTGR